MFLLAFWVFSACVAAVLARGKNRSAAGWFLLGLVFGPFAWIVAALPTPAEPPQRIGGIGGIKVRRPPRSK